MNDAVIRVAEVGPGRDARHPLATRFNDLTALLLQPAFDAVLLEASPEENRRLIHALRSHRHYGLSLIHCRDQQNAEIQALSDGPADDWQTLERQCLLHRERLAVFNNGRAPQTPQAHLLAYLWLRGPGRLRALRQAAHPQHYDFPLVRCLAGETTNSVALVRDLAQRGLLESTALIDRIRLCRRCGSGQLNYVDVCTECNSLDIRRQASLHCFTCGHIGRQAQFLKDGALVCPNCVTRLRHIGSDYDRPLENYTCNVCQAFFIDADIEARCLDCGEAHSPEQLHVREIRDYQLSEAGMLAARQGLERDSEPLFGALAMVGATTFRTLLDWQLELIERHKAPRFALLGLRFHNLGKVLERLGPQRGHALLDALIERIQVAIRDTDRCTRTSEEQLWLLLMYTDGQGLERVVERLNRISELFVGEELKDIRLATVGCVAPEGLFEKETAELLMARLAGELQ